MNISLRVCGQSVKFHKPNFAAAIAVLLFGLVGCASINTPERQPITLEQIVAMAKDGWKKIGG